MQLHAADLRWSATNLSSIQAFRVLRRASIPDLTPPFRAEQALSTAPEPAPPAQPAGSTATPGERLIDLNKAREAGAVTDEEYEAAKKRILDSLKAHFFPNQIHVGVVVR